MSHSIKQLRGDSTPSPSRLWYNHWVEENIKGLVLDIGKSTYWDYGFPTIDTNPDLNPTFIGDICHSDLPSDTYDTILCNGMYECVSDPQKMIDEVWRILKPGGKAIFGFVGSDYPPYKEDWKFYHKNLKFNGKIEEKDFDHNYHFIIVQKI